MITYEGKAKGVHDKITEVNVRILNEDHGFGLGEELKEFGWTPYHLIGGNIAGCHKTSTVNPEYKVIMNLQPGDKFSEVKVRVKNRETEGTDLGTIPDDVLDEIVEYVDEIGQTLDQLKRKAATAVGS